MTTLFASEFLGRVRRARHGAAEVWRICPTGLATEHTDAFSKPPLGISGKRI